MTNLLVVYYSAYGHVHEMALAAAQGAANLADCEVRVVKIPEMESENNRTPYLDRRKKQEESALSGKFRTVGRFAKYEGSKLLQAPIPFATNDDLRWADGIVWGFPTYFGSMPAQVKLFLEFASELCADGGLEGKPAGLITSAGSIHTGHEANLLTSMVPLFHFGMIMVGLPYSENPEYLTADAIGCSPYGASTVAGPDSGKTPDERELVMAGRLGLRVAKVAAALKKCEFQSGQ
ncbi:NAD(P)H:quinone oxidoreductase [Paenibacillus sacheonensis]|uniref:NAD(P)H:quinone oxidoreductase n=1 Tax=Paenibacillus sacheonensis TaxID=742054 RepID=A0A7X4YLP7_9BACL|nr:NAD(P)H:quinone oxidoreductase [Paenibacillus sacheonensis]MBM7566020.1 NAD(P)H dehydrogenase (quinone) [Paenibacillus sacheonensis]NBC68668.1 NAD(P)H:quinone oxidoreductase [Paenibacillus sacheonensis]